MRYQHRALHDWPGKLRQFYERRNSRFRADWGRTMHDLERELDHLDAQDIVLETAHTETDMRLDGTLRGSAKQPAHPGVVVSFESRYGPLRYWTDAFIMWQENVRAIALGLEALRAVDRYGITLRGEQYTGWAKLGPGSGVMDGVKPQMTPDLAKATIAEILGLHKTALVTADADTVHSMYRLAAKKAHPDAGGATETWKKLNEAATVLGVK